MAGGKLTPRQKMINLMYLVFIAMLAMNMSKEVLSAFGLMNERFEGSNISAVDLNEQMLQALKDKGGDARYKEAAIIGTQIQTASNELYEYIGKLKGDVVKDFEIDPETGKLPYEAMDKGETIDNLWFDGDGYSPKGEEIIQKINKYKNTINSLLKDSKYASILKEVNTKFETADVKDKEGIKIKFLKYHFDGFPAIASLAKLSAWQNDIKKTEADTYSGLLGKAAVAAASMNTFQAIVVLEKNAYFEGEVIKGKVVLGKYDSNTVPTGFEGPGKIENGQAVISMNAGSVGEHNIGGSFTFMEDKAPIKIPFKGTYVVVPRPKSATISADKMNVVYRGVANPMSISFAGVANSSVTATGAGLSSNGNGSYTMNPQGGTDVTINVSAKLPDGKSVSDAKVFRIKNVPSPMGGIGKETGTVKGAKSRLEVSQVSAELKDFPFDLTFVVKQFAFKVPGQPTIIVNGDRVNAQCKSALQRAVKGDMITISDIKTVIPGSQIVTPKTAPVIYELQ